MAHTNSTANYSLSQFVGTDKPTFLGDYNGDMLKIDTAIKGAADDASGAVTTANAASALATDAASTATSAASDASAASATATTALNTANNATTTAQSASTTATSAATDAASAVSTANAAMSAATGAATASGTSYDNTTSGLVADTVQSAIDEIVAGGGAQHGLFELWVNPNGGTSATYAGGTVEVDFDPDTDDALEIEYAFSNSESLGVTSKRYEKAAFTSATLNASEQELTISSSGIISKVSRDVTISYATKKATIVFAGGAIATFNTYGTAPTTSTNDAYVIPLRILKLVHNV